MKISSGVIFYLSIFLPSLILFSCGSFDRKDAAELVRTVGVDRILNACQTLQKFSSQKNESIPSENWPPALVELKPRSLTVDNNGVFVAISGFYVQGEGLYILFKDKESPKERWGDPSFWKVANRIFWYQFTG